MLRRQGSGQRCLRLGDQRERVRRAALGQGHEASQILRLATVHGMSRRRSGMARQQIGVCGLGRRQVVQTPLRLGPLLLHAQHLGCVGRVAQALKAGRRLVQSRQRPVGLPGQGQGARLRLARQQFAALVAMTLGHAHALFGCRLCRLGVTQTVEGGRQQAPLVGARCPRVYAPPATPVAALPPGNAPGRLRSTPACAPA